MLLRNGVSFDGRITFLLRVRGVDDALRVIPVLLVLGGTEVLLLRLVDHFPMGLEILDKWMGRREAGSLSFVWDVGLAVGLGVLRRVSAIPSVDCDVSRGRLIY